VQSGVKTIGKPKGAIADRELRDLLIDVDLCVEAKKASQMLTVFNKETS